MRFGPHSHMVSLRRIWNAFAFLRLIETITSLVFCSLFSSLICNYGRKTSHPLSYWRTGKLMIINLKENLYSLAWCYIFRIHVKLIWFCVHLTNIHKIKWEKMVYGSKKRIQKQRWHTLTDVVNENWMSKTNSLYRCCVANYVRPVPAKSLWLCRQS